MPRVGSSDQQDFRQGVQPVADDYFLLVTAAQRARLHAQTGVLIASDWTISSANAVAAGCSTPCTLNRFMLAMVRLSRTANGRTSPWRFRSSGVKPTPCAFMFTGVGWVIRSPLT